MEKIKQKYKTETHNGSDHLKHKTLPAKNMSVKILLYYYLIL